MSTAEKKPTASRHRDGLVGITIRDFPLPLKKRIAAAAEAEGTNAQDLVVTVLAAAYGVKFVPGGRRSPGSSSSTQMYFAMPRTLRRKLNQDAARRETFTRSIVLHILTEKFGSKR